jgi:hypothetical protein
MPATLPISELINVNVVLAPAAAQAQDLSTMLVLGSSDVIDVVERMREYTSLAAVAADFGTTAPEYLAAVLWFEQSPQPTSISIGRWARTATSGQLICAPLSAANQLLASWNTINNGGFKITVDGGAEQAVEALDFSVATTLDGIAAIIQAGLDTNGVAATIVYDAVNTRFVITANSTGVGSTVSFLSTPNSSTDISSMMGGTADDSGAYVADGVAVETAVTAATLFDNYFGQTWYALVMPQIDDNDDHVAVAAYIEGSDNKHLYGVTTQEAGALSAVSTTDIAYRLSQLGYNRSIVQYSSESAYAICSALGRLLTVNYNGNSTVITLMYKQEPGIVAESLTPTQMVNVAAKNCNVFVNFNNNTAILRNGVMSSGEFADNITDTDWLAVTIMNTLYNLLYTSPTKIPQTDSGGHILVTACEAVCSQGVANGTLAPGTWNSNGFGGLSQGDFLPKGFYVYIQPIAQQNQADREARRAPPIQIAAKLAGAVHSVDVTINVNR